MRFWTKTALENDNFGTGGAKFLRISSNFDDFMAQNLVPLKSRFKKSWKFKYFFAIFVLKKIFFANFYWKNWKLFQFLSFFSEKIEIFLSFFIEKSEFFYPKSLKWFVNLWTTQRILRQDFINVNIIHYKISFRVIVRS